MQFSLLHDIIIYLYYFIPVHSRYYLVAYILARVSVCVCVALVSVCLCTRLEIGAVVISNFLPLLCHTFLFTIFIFILTALNFLIYIFLIKIKNTVNNDNNNSKMG